MGFSLKDFLEEASAQVNFRDGGKTAATVRAARPPAPAKLPAKPAPGYGSNPITRATNAVRDVFDANSVQDTFKRQQDGFKPLYRDQQLELGNKRPMDNFGQQIFGNTARFANTLKAGAGGVYGVGNVAKESLFGTDDSYNQAVRGANQTLQRDLSPTSGLLRAGTFFDDAKDARNISGIDLAGLTLASGLGVAGEALPMARGAKLLNASKGTIAKEVAIQGIGAGGADIGQQMVETGQIDPLRTAGAVAAGAVLTAAPPLAYKAIKPAIEPTTRLVSSSAAMTKELIVGPPRPYANISRDEAYTARIVREANQGLRSSFDLTEEDMMIYRGVQAKLGVGMNDVKAIDDMLGAMQTYETRQMQIQAGALGNDAPNAPIKRQADLDAAPQTEQVIIPTGTPKSVVDQIVADGKQPVFDKTLPKYSEAPTTPKPEPSPTPSKNFSIGQSSTNKELSDTLGSGSLYQKDIVITSDQPGKPKQIHGTVISSAGGEVRRVDGTMFSSADNPGGEHYVASGATSIRDADGTVHTLDNAYINKVESASKPLTKYEQLMADFKASQSDTKPTLQDALAGKSTKVGTPEATPQKLSRFANRTVQNSKEVSDPTKKLVKAEKVSYDTTTNAGRQAKAEADLAGKSDDEAFTSVIQGLSSDPSEKGQHVVNAITLAKRLDGADDEASQFKATEIFSQISTRLTERGQEIQAASMLAARTPQGLRYKAQKDIQKALGKDKFTPEMQAELKNFTKTVEKTDSDLTSARKQLDTITAADTVDAKALEVAQKRVADAERANSIARDDVQYFVASKIPTETADKVVNFWRSGLLTAPTTTGGAGIGNAAMTLSRKLWINPAATLTDAIIGLGSKQRSYELAKAGEFGKGLKAGAKNATSRQYWKTGYDPMNGSITADSMGTNSRVINYGDGKIGKPIGAYVNGVYKLMGAADQPFRYAANKEIISSMAKAAAKNQKLTGQAKTDFIKDFIKNPPAEIKQQAMDETLGSTFQNKTAMATIVQGAKKWARQSNLPKAAAVVDFLIPFAGIPSAVADRAVRHTGIKAGKEIVKAVVRAKKGEPMTLKQQRELAMYIGEGTIGLPIVGAGFALAQAGMFNGAYPQDAKERALWVAEGRQENSVKVGDRWYSMNYIQPFGVLMSLGAGIQQTEGENGQQAKIDDYVKNGAMSAVKSFAGQSYLEGIQAPIEAINDPDQFLDKYIASTASSSVPNLIRSAASATDSVQRDAKGIIAGVKGAIPGLRQTLPEKQDMFGGSITKKDSAANMFLNPLKPSKSKGSDDVATAEIRRLYNGDEGILPTKARKDAFKGQTIDAKQMREINGKAGPAMKAAYVQTINDPKYQALNDEDKRKALAKVNDTVYGSLKAQYGLDNGLVSQADTSIDTKQKNYLKNGKLAPITAPSLANSGGGDGDVSEIPDGMNNNDIAVLQRFDAMDADQKDKAIRSDPKAEYSLQVAQFERDKKLNKFSRAELIDKKEKIAKSKVGSTFTKDAREIYGLDKDQAYELLSTAKDGSKMADEILKYGDALVDAGLLKYNKFRDRKVNVAIRPKATGGGSGRKSSGTGRSGGSRKTDFSLFGGGSSAGSSVALSKTLRQLVANAKLS